MRFPRRPSAAAGSVPAMTAPAPAAAPGSNPGVAKAHRALAILFIVLAVVAFYLAGLGVFGEGFDAHLGVARGLLLLSLILLVLAVVGRKAAVQPSAVLVGLMVLQSILANVGEDVSVLGALHPLNGILALAVAGLTITGRRVDLRAGHGRRPAA